MFIEKSLEKSRPALIHLLLSAFIVGLILLFFKITLYPGLIFSATGANSIFLILFLVDITLGPFLTFIVFNKHKPELKRDLTVIVVIQIMALIYGITSLYQARPVYFVFAVDRFELITANRITPEHLSEAKLDRYSVLPKTNIKWVVAQTPETYEDRTAIFMETLNGSPDLAQRPKFYIDYERGKEDIVDAAKPIDYLLSFNLSEDLEKYNKTTYGFLPLMASKKSLTIIIDKKTGERLDILDIDPWQVKKESQIELLQ